MDSTVINIGLSVGDAGEPLDQLAITLKRLQVFAVILDIKVAQAKGSNWKNERTLVVKIAQGLSEGAFERLLREICNDLNQGAIAYRHLNQHGKLVYNSQYEGERFEFNSKYFITF